MKLARVTSKGQTTIPKSIREACGIQEGDVLTVAIEGQRVVMTRLETTETDYLQSLETTLDEWLSPEDEAAYRDL